MPFPTQREVEIPLLKVLNQLGGQATPQDTYPKVAEYFPQLTEKDLDERLPSSPSTVKWWNLVQWARQRLVEVGEIDGSTRGVWKITNKGLQRIGVGAFQQPTPKITATVQSTEPETNLKDLVYHNKEAVMKRIVTELNSLSPSGFEHFCLALLEGLGYESVVVTGKTGDGGIDGYGDYRQGVVKIKSAFQAKRWKESPVGRPEIDKFRGAIQGDYEHGVFLTTNNFTKEAQAASVKKGAITILLLDGNTIADHMISSGIGVRKEPIYLLDIDDDFFTFEKDIMQSSILAATSAQK